MQSIIEDITAKMGAGMAQFARKPDHVTSKSEYNLVCLFE
jgi:hypothetical protein